MDNIYQAISKLKEIVKNDPNGCLPLLYRKQLIDILKADNLLEKVYFECAKKIYLCWKSEFGDSYVPYRLLNEVEDYLYRGKVELSVIRELADKSRRYFNCYSNRFCQMGYVFLAVCYYITDGEDWFRDEYKDCGNLVGNEWDLDPCFLSSLIWAGGGILEDDLNIDRCREFWNWYLYMVFRISERSESGVLKLEQPAYLLNQQSSKERSQSILSGNMQNHLQNIADLVVEEYQTFVWDVAEIEVYRFDYSALIFSLRQENRKSICRLSLVLMNKIYEYMEEIHRKMYVQARKEGAWVQCILSILRDRSYTFGFNYDDITRVPQTIFEPADFVLAFERYPRSRDYTPLWWQRLLGKNVKYIK